MREKLEGLKAKLDALRPFAPELQDRIDKVLLPRRIHYTNAFEDNSLALEETRYFLDTQRMVGGKLEREFHEIKGVLEAIYFLRQLLEAGESLNEENIKKLHFILTKPIEQDERYYPGQYRLRDLPILGQDSSRLNFASCERISAEMTSLLEWRQHNSDSLPALDLAAKFHYRFSLIHPFMEGNGRVARLIDDFILIKAGYGPAIVTDQEQYFQALRAADQSLPQGDRLASAENANLEKFSAVLEECSCASMQLMLDVIENRALPEVSSLESRMSIFDKIISGDLASNVDRRVMEEKETTKLAIAREIDETLKQKVHSKVVRFALSGPAKFQQNNHQFSPLISEVSNRHKFVFSPAEILYEYHLAPDLGEIEANGLSLKPFMRLLSFAVLSHGENVGIFSGVLSFEFGKVYIKQENRAELLLKLETESVRELIGSAFYRDWDLNEFKKFIYDSMDYYFQQIERDYLWINAGDK